MIGVILLRMRCREGVGVMRISTGKYSLLLLSLTFLVPVGLQGQQKDFQSWWEFSIDKGFDNGIDLSGEIEQRFKNNSLQYDRSLVTVAGEYDIKKYLEVAAGFRAFLDSDRELQLNAKYRVHMDVTGSHSLSRYDLSLRARFQYGFEDIFDPAYSGGNNFVNRYRLKVANHIFGTRFGWFATVESWHLLSDQPNRLFYKMRYSAGVEYALNFKSEFTVRYILEDELNVANPLQAHILVFGFSHSL